ncbi:MAG: HAMP domain-containing histidine kinase, partial [Deltaproteobacteria bacterium]|nr:HAMP domain-containing histidine kinase [Deltaproteobacteria bacterium]
MSTTQRQPDRRPDRRNRDNRETERDLFIATLGHDLRNPLATIAAGCALIERGTAPNDSNRAVIGRMIASVERMSRLIDQTLECARLQHEGVRLARRRCDLVELCVASIDESELREPGIPIVLQAPDELLGVWDPDRLAQVIDNLIGNALTHGYGGVWINLERDDDGVRLSVHNWGPVIPSELLPTLFDPFRGTSTRGLGLFIVDRLVRAHGGSLAVESSERRRDHVHGLPPASAGRG